MMISNWNGSHRCSPAAKEAPQNVVRLREIVLDTATFPSPVRALGELHSLNESIETNGTAVFMTHFDEIGPPDLQNHTVTVGAGVRMIDLNNALKKHGLQLPVVPEIGNATAGSVACCGTKDSSLGPNGLGQISSAVVGVRMITATGRDVHVTGSNELRLIRSSYGLLGIIYEVTFRVEPRKKVRYEYARIRLDDWLKTAQPLPPPDGSEILTGAHGFLGFLLPYRRELIIERRRLAKRQEPRFGDGLKLWARTFAWRWGARPFNTLLRQLPRPLRRRAIALYVSVLETWVLRLFFLRLLGRFESYRADAMIDFKRPASSYFDFTFWAFPVSSWDRVVPAYLEFCDQFKRQTGFRPALPTEVYFIRKDDSAALSFSFDQDIYTLDMVNWTDEEPAHWREMNRAFCTFAAEHGGRPLLNQTKGFTRSAAQHVWTPGWYALAKARQLEDPDGRFLTPFLRDLLPS
jgi:FAD binding domain/D-arabinono-1,4-lactone oxidase